MLPVNSNAELKKIDVVMQKKSVRTVTKLGTIIVAKRRISVVSTKKRIIAVIIAKKLVGVHSKRQPAAAIKRNKNVSVKSATNAIAEALRSAAAGTKLLRSGNVSNNNSGNLNVKELRKKIAFVGNKSSKLPKTLQFN